MIDTSTRWHETQRARLLKALDAVETFPQPTKGELGNRLISLHRAVQSLHGRSRQGSNHHTVAFLISEVEDQITEVQAA